MVNTGAVRTPSRLIVLDYLGNTLRRFSSSTLEWQVMEVNQISQNRIKRNEREAPVMTLKSLYVGNLPYHATEEDVRSLFADYSPAGVRVIPDKGFGFVEVAEDAADDAIAALNGVDFQGRSLTVNEARPRPERTGEGGYHRRR